jgi:hypothetical protein
LEGHTEGRKNVAAGGGVWAALNPSGGRAGHSFQPT